ncbi:C80 family cysteine peptidase [Lysobacter firmicutimachus]|uniref:C80 family cysteine peptidase n=1 Tax=Lysobacter firmicutimachus TaxID=1792846 RepID=A0ABU8D5Q7_9GAMM
MNAKLYRLIFDIRTGALIPVAEITCGAKKSPQSSAGGAGRAFVPRALCLMLALACHLPGSVLAQATPDQTAGASAPSVSNTANGTALINIVDPNASGLSHNKFTRFDVSAPGVVFNNSQADGVSKIGGYTINNPNLSRPANAILAEVTGNEASRISGALEVFGKSADLLIANQNGLYVNGLSTINANSLLLTTGRPIQAGAGFEVGGGQVNIAGPVNTTGLRFFDVVARSIELNGAVAGDAQLKFAAGLNAYDVGTREVRKLADGAVEGAPQYAISGSAVGAMHGSAVQLISTESGLGVRHAGTITSSGDIHISSDGALVVERGATVAADAGVQVSAAGLVNSGRIESVQNAGFVLGSLDNADTGQVRAGAALNVRAGSVTNTGVVSGVDALSLSASGQVDNRGQLLSQGDLSLSAAQMLNHGALAQVYGGVRSSLNVGGDLVNSDQAVWGGGDVTLSAGGALRNDGATISGAKVDMRSGAGVYNDSGASVEASDRLDINSDGTLNNIGGSRILADKTATVAATAGVVNEGGSSIASSGELVVASREGAVSNSGRAKLFGAKAATVSAKSGVTNFDQATIGSLGALAITSGAGVRNSNGSGIVADSVSITATGELYNQAAEISATKNVSATAGSIENREKGTVSATYIDLKSAGSITNAEGAIIAAGESTSLDGGEIVNDQATLQSAGNAQFRAARDITNTGGTIAATDRISIAARALRNNSRGTVAAGNLDIAAARVDNTGPGSALQAADGLSVTADLIHNSGELSADRVMAKAAQLTNSGRIAASTDAKLSAAALDNQTQGTIEAGQDATLDAGSYANTGKIVSGRNAELTLRGGGDFRLTGTTLAPSAHGALTLNVGRYSADRDLENIGDIRINAAGDIDLDNGLLSGGDIALNSAGDIRNRSLLWAKGDIQLRSDELRNESGAEIEALRDVKIDARAVTNAAGGRIVAKRDIAIDAERLQNEVTSSGGVKVTGESRGRKEHIDYHNAIRKDKYELSIGQTYNGTFVDKGKGLETLGSDIKVTAQGVIEAGGEMRLNQAAQKGKAATVKNSGQILSGNDLHVGGTVENIGVMRQVSLQEYLQRETYIEIKVKALEQRGNKEFNSLWELLDNIYSKEWSEGLGIAGINWDSREVNYAIQQFEDIPVYNQLLSKVFGPDWRAVDYDTLIERWNAFKGNVASKDPLKFTADKPATIAAGGSVLHADGSGAFINGDGAKRENNKPLTVSVGSRQVETVEGNFAVAVNLGELIQSLRPADVWKNALSGVGAKKFVPNRAQSPDKAAKSDPGIYPLYETRLPFIDQSQFYGSEYFFQQVGYNPGRTISVIGDNYLINELINQQVKRLTGGFLNSYYHSNGLRLAQQLLFNAGQVDDAIGLTVGVEPTRAQLDKLDRDIVWLVATQVDGQDVLVPTLYLASKTLTAIKEGRADGVAGVSAGKDVRISADAGGVSNVNGSISARGNVKIDSTSTVDNASGMGLDGGIRAGRKIEISAKGDVTNVGASIAAADVAVKTEGSFASQARTTYNDKGDLIVADKGAVDATGRVSIQADKDIKLQAARITGKDIELTAGNDVLTSDIHEVESRLQHKTGSAGFLGLGSSSETTKTVSAIAQGTQIVASGEGSTLKVEAGRDIALEGGEYAADQGTFKAGRNSTAKTSQDYSHTETKVVKEGLVVGVQGGIGGYGAGAEWGLDGPKVAVATPQNQSAGSDKVITGELGSARIGYERVEETTTHDTVKNRNAKFNFGSKLDVIAGGTADLGGADIRAVKGEGDNRVNGDISIVAADVKTTKYEDVDERSTQTKNTFAGLSSSVQSSVADTVGKSMTLANKTKEGMEVDPGLTALQAAGDATNLAFNDLAASSTKVGIRHEETTSKSSTRSENTSSIVGNIKIKSTQGDIALSGVTLDGGKGSVELDSARDIKLGAAKTTTHSESTTQSHDVTLLEASASVAPGGAGIGLSTGYQGSIDKTVESGASYSHTQVNGGSVTLKSKRDTALVGATVEADDVTLDVGRNLKVESVQDTSQMRHETGNWGATVGAAVTTQSIVAPTFSVNGGGGADYDNSALTNTQSGIKASKNLVAKVGGNVHLKGGHLVDENGGGSLDVAGRIVAEELQDSRHKDGGSGGGGGGISKTGLASVDLSIERVDQVHYEATQHATLAGLSVNAAGGTRGRVNTDAGKLETVTEDRKIAGNSAGITIGVGDVKESLGKKIGSSDSGKSGASDGSRSSRKADDAATAPRKPEAESVAAKPDGTTSPAQDDGRSQSVAGDASLQVQLPRVAESTDTRGGDRGRIGLADNQRAGRTNPAVVPNAPSRSSGESVATKPDGVASPAVGDGRSRSAAGDALSRTQAPRAAESADGAGGSERGRGRVGNDQETGRTNLAEVPDSPNGRAVDGADTEVAQSDAARSVVANGDDRQGPEVEAGRSQSLTTVNKDSADAAKPTDKYDQRVIVQLESDATSEASAKRIFDKHPDNSVLIKRDALGNHAVVEGELRAEGGRTKLELVGHGDGAGDGAGSTRLAGLDAAGLAQEVAGLRDELSQGGRAQVDLAKVNTVGCDTGSCTRPGLAQDVGQDLQARGIDVPVKGYDGRVGLTETGHKRPVEEGGLGRNRRGDGRTDADGGQKVLSDDVVRNELDRYRSSVPDAELAKLKQRLGAVQTKEFEKAAVDRERAEVLASMLEGAPQSSIDKAPKAKAKERLEQEWKSLTAEIKSLAESENSEQAWSRILESHQKKLSDDDAFKTLKSRVDALVSNDFQKKASQRELAAISHDLQKSVAEFQKPTNPAPRDMARVPTEVMTNWMSGVQQTISELPSGPARKSLEGLLADAESQWLKHDLKTGDVRSMLEKAVTSLGSGEVPQGRKLKDLAARLDGELAEYGRDQQPPATRLFDNVYGRTFETAMVDHLVRNPPEDVKRSMEQFGAALWKSIAEKESDRNFDRAIETLRSTLDKSDNRRFWMAEFEKKNPEYKEFLSLTSPADPDAYDKVVARRKELLKTILNKPVQDGLDVIARPFLAVKLATELKSGSSGSIELPGVRTANDNYGAIQSSVGRVDPGNILKIGQRSTQLAANAAPPDIREKVIPSGRMAGITLAHQPPAAGTSADGGSSKRPTLSNEPIYPDSERLRELSGAHKSEKPTTAAMLELENGIPFGSGVSGSTNLIVHMVDAANKKGAQIDPRHAMLAAGMFLTYDGGHSLHEMLWTLNQTEGKAKHGILNGHQTVEPDASKFKADYQAYFDGFKNDPKTKALLDQAVKRGFDAMRDLRRERVCCDPFAPAERPEDAGKRTGGASKPTDKYDQRVLVNLQPGDAISVQSARRAFEKHPDNSVLMERDAQGNHVVVAGKLHPDGGRTKLELFGHGDGAGGGTSSKRLAGLDAAGLVQEVTGLRDELSQDGRAPVDLAKVNTVGCDTGSCTRPGLAQDVGRGLQARGIDVPVKGYDGRVGLNDGGQKRRVETGGLGRPSDTSADESDRGGDASASAPPLAAGLPPPPPPSSGADFAKLMADAASKKKAEAAATKREAEKQGMTGLTDNDAALIRTYSGQSYSPINKFLRGQENTSALRDMLLSKGYLDDNDTPLNSAEFESAARAFLGDMTRAMLKLPPPQGLEVTYRGLALDTAGLEGLKRSYMSEGSIVTSESFLSTSPSKSWINDTILVIDLPPGHAARDIGAVAAFKGEDEVLMPPGTKLRIDEVLVPGNPKFMEKRESLPLSDTSKGKKDGIKRIIKVTALPYDASSFPDSVGQAPKVEAEGSQSLVKAGAGFASASKPAEGRGQRAPDRVGAPKTTQVAFGRGVSSPARPEPLQRGTGIGGGAGTGVSYPPLKSKTGAGTTETGHKRPAESGSSASAPKDRAIIKQVEREFVTPQHRLAIEEASRQGNFAISFRAAGPATLAALEKGAAAKGHDILEKTIKSSSMAKAYGENSPEMQKVRDAGIEGYVGHWDKNGKLKGIYLSSEHGLGDAVDGNVYPIDMDRLEESLSALKKKANWQALPFTGDYDAHDMLTFRGAGRPHTPLVGSKTERSIMGGINRSVAAVDKNRPVEAIEHNVIRHGPQVNFSSYMLKNEAGKVKKDGGLLGVVARPGEFPVAMVDRGKWSIINDANELAEYYKSVGAQVKETWNPDGVRTFKDSATRPGVVNYGRSDDKTAKPAVPKAQKPTTGK